MNTKQISFETVKQRAEVLKTEFQIALVYPDKNLIDAGVRAVENSLARIIAIHNESISGIQTIIVEDPEEAVLRSIDLAVIGKVNTIAKGFVNTAKFLSKIIRSDFRTGYMTHTSIIEVPGFSTLFVISDGTVTPHPNIEQKIEIIKNSIKCAKILGIERPKVALLSANELVLGNVSSGHDAVMISKMAKHGQITDAIIDGPMSLDSALSLEAVHRKKLNFLFNPPADILIVPDLESGALLIKSAVYFGKAIVAGVLWGTQQPIVLTSRADTAEAKYISMCICKLAMAGE